MKRWFIGGLFCMLMFGFPLTLMAEDYLAQADTLYDQGGIENILKSIPLYIKAVEANPNSYEANWKCARAHRDYGDEAKTQNIEGWKEICKKYGKEGMKYAEKAMELEPNKVEGNFWYGCCVGVYSDGVSILTAIREGLKGKTQKGFEKSYNADKMYEDGGPMIALGRFWSVLPWPMKKNKKALEYLREALKYFPDNPETQVYLAEVLIDEGEKDEAKTWLEKAAKGDEKYYSDRAKELLANMK